jgi:hypothetical protein
MKPRTLWTIAMVVCSLFLIATCSVEAADVTITDGIDDVSQVDYFTGETIVVTSNPNINVADLDIISATYTKVGQKVTLTLQVRGNILDRGQIVDLEGGDLTTFDTVEYGFQLVTSEQEYLVSYSNKTSTLSRGDEQINLTSSDFSVVGDTLTVMFDLLTSYEEYENLTVTTTFIKADLNNPNPADFVYLSDIAPNPPLEIYTIDASNVGSVGETIQFNGSVAPFTGQPPYRYRWDFGDQGTSTELNPTHIYTKAGTFTYTFTVTDQADVSVSETGSITISSGGGSSGPVSNQMLLFLAILAIVIVVGIVIIVWIIRR